MEYGIDQDAAKPAPGTGLAIASLVLGIIGLVLIPLAVVALVLGIIALTKGQSKGLAIPGVVLGGLGTLLFPLAIIAAIAIPNLLESRVTAYEAAAKASLKAGVFPAQVQFQGGAYLDEDGDGIGEGGFLDEMAGAGGKPLSLLPPSWRQAVPMSGYRFVLYLPDGEGAAASRAEIQDRSAAAIDARERHWIAYAWPETWGQSGRRAFAILPNGQLLTTKPSSSGSRPEWNAALSAGWGSAPASGWTPYTR